MANTVSRNINYLSQDFNSFRQSLLDLARTYYKNTWINFSNEDVGMMFTEMSSYVGDVLSLYLNRNFAESMLLYSNEPRNIIQQAQSIGYKPRLSVPSKVKLSVYQLVPATGTAVKEPDYNYAFVLKRGMIVSTGNVDFRTLEDVDFNQDTYNSPRIVSVYSVDGTGDPEYFLLKKTVLAKAGNLKTATFDFIEPVQYNKVQLADPDFIEIYNITDLQGNTWYEVEYLAQDTIFVDIENTEENTPDMAQYSSATPYVLKLKRVSKRFITRINELNNVDIRFGAGVLQNSDEEFLPNPQDVGLGTVFGVDNMNYEYNVANFLYTDAYGEVPANTTLTVKYFSGGGVKTNVQPNTISQIIENNIITNSNLNTSVVEYCKNSIAVNNLEAAYGGRDAETLEEIRNNALASLSAQSRVVTEKDYVFRTMTMPSRFGSVAKAHIEKDIADNNLNLYVLTYDVNKKLTTINPALKQNIATYLNEYRIATDTINIYDAYPINIKVSFEVSVLPGYNGKEVLTNCITTLKDYFDIDKWNVGQPIIKIEIINLLANVRGVQSVFQDSLQFECMYDDTLGYWNNFYNLETATINGVIFPSKTPSIFEVKYPDTDIYGKIRSY